MVENISPDVSSWSPVAAFMVPCLRMDACLLISTVVLWCGN